MSQKYNAGDTVRLNYCDDKTIYTIEYHKYNTRHGHIYNLKEIQGWKAQVNLSQVNEM